MKTEPPFVPAMYGNFQMAPRPTAEPALARMKPRREPQLVVVWFSDIGLDSDLVLFARRSHRVA